jgi:RHS repeat-associated protein
LVTYTYEKYGIDMWEVKQDFWGNQLTPVGNESANVWVDLNGMSSDALTMRRVYGPGWDNLEARLDNSNTVRWYLNDRLGSVIGAVSDSGSVLTAITYQAFGTQVSGASIDRYGFQGREYDALVKAYYFRDRMYDPEVRRFLSEDPIEFLGGDYNLYRFVGNNPTNYIDPSGLESWWQTIKIYAAATWEVFVEEPATAVVNGVTAVANDVGNNYQTLRNDGYGPVSAGLIGTMATAGKPIDAAVQRTGEVYQQQRDNGENPLGAAVTTLLYGVATLTGVTGVDEAVRGTTVNNEPLTPTERVSRGLMGVGQFILTVIAPLAGGGAGPKTGVADDAPKPAPAPGEVTFNGQPVKAPIIEPPPAGTRSGGTVAPRPGEMPPRHAPHNGDISPPINGEMPIGQGEPPRINPPRPIPAVPDPPIPPKPPRVQFPENPGQVQHIFRNEPGHIPDTPSNRMLLQDVANDPSSVLGPDKFGNTWAARINADGSQTWVQYRGNTIINGGVNNPPKLYNPDTGLSAQSPPNRSGGSR